MTRTELKEYLKDLYVYLSPQEKRYLCDRYPQKYFSLKIPVLEIFYSETDFSKGTSGKTSLGRLKDFLLERKNGKNLVIKPAEVPLEEQNQKIEQFVKNL